MFRSQKGFTLIELMIVVVIIGILAAIAIPNFIAMQNRAKEGSTKANMHTLQLAAEDYGVQNDGVYTANAEAAGAAGLAAMLPANFKNPFTNAQGADAAFEDRGTFAAPSVALNGLSSYSDSSTTQYNVKGHGKTAAISLTLTSGQ
jgi:type IV pilus assembly protein PilA